MFSKKYPGWRKDKEINKQKEVDMNKEIDKYSEASNFLGQLFGEYDMKPGVDLSLNYQERPIKLDVVERLINLKHF